MLSVDQLQIQTAMMLIGKHAVAAVLHQVLKDHAHGRNPVGFVLLVTCIFGYIIQYNG